MKDLILLILSFLGLSIVSQTNSKRDSIHIWRDDDEQLWKEYKDCFKKLANSNETLRKKLFFNRKLKFREHVRKFQNGSSLYFPAFNRFTDMVSLAMNGFF